VRMSERLTLGEFGIDSSRSTAHFGLMLTKMLVIFRTFSWLSWRRCEQKLTAFSGHSGF
jgi:hypothetical protein